MVAELASAATAVATVAGKMLPELKDYLQKNQKLRKDLDIAIDSISDECRLINALIEEDTRRRHMSGNGTHVEWITMVRELAYKIDDTVDRFTRDISLKLEPGASLSRRALNRVMTRKARTKFAKEIIRLKNKSAQVHLLRETYSATLLVPQAVAATGTSTHAASPVGMGAAQKELKKLITEERGSQVLRVISLVGFGGIGKSQLAMDVYGTIKSEYQACAWVSAAGRGDKDILKDILEKLGTDPKTIRRSSGGSADEAMYRKKKLCETIVHHLGIRRFLIVIDDMRVDFWDGIKDAFPVIPGIRSTVIVTTTRQSIAQNCSGACGDVYHMRTLEENHSKQLLIGGATLAHGEPHANDIMLCSEAIKKCDGLPLALANTATYLRSVRDRERWAYLCENLGHGLETDANFASMKGVLVRSYTSLGKQDAMNCLLYLGIYPSGHPIRRASLLRRWLADGFITTSDLSAASLKFSELVERSIIQQPIGASRAEVKTCKTHGIMLEFILHNTDKFVTLLYDKATLPDNVRWLSLHAANSKIDPKKIGLVRSLTIFGKTHKSALDFSKYKLMRVLDLEECKEHLKDKHLKSICKNLLLLRYLSLGASVTVTVLPKEIKRLQHLETLDVRKTNIEIQLKQVLGLPCLVHLFGKLKLHKSIGNHKIRKVHTWLLANSKLQTIAGFVVDESQEMPQLINHMEHLTKVKIWCESIPVAGANISHLAQAIKGFIERGTVSKQNKAGSLSLNFNAGWPQDLLSISLDEGELHYLKSLKLQGNSICSQLPVFVSKLFALGKLCLSFPGHTLSSDILDALIKAPLLEHLKLVAYKLEKQVIGHSAFGSLLSLCIVAEVMTELVIEDGALPRLQSLWLICKDLNGFSGGAILSLPVLKEVALHDEVSKPRKDAWEEASNTHPKRPKLLFVTKEMIDDLFKPMRSGAAAVTATNMTVSTTTPSDSISTGQSVTVVTSEARSEPATEINYVAPATKSIDNTGLPVSHDAISKTQQDNPAVVVTSTASEPPADLAAPATIKNTMMPANHDSTTAQQDHPERRGEPATDNPPAPATTDITMMPTDAQQERPAVSTEIGSVSLSIIAIANAQQDHTGNFVPAITFETGTQPAVDTPHALATTDTSTTISVQQNGVTNTQQGHPVVSTETGSETVTKLPDAPATTNMMMSTHHDAVSNAEKGYPAQVPTC